MGGHQGKEGQSWLCGSPGPRNCRSLGTSVPVVSFAPEQSRLFFTPKPYPEAVLTNRNSPNLPCTPRKNLRLGVRGQKEPQEIP